MPRRTPPRVMEITTPLDPHLLFHAMHAREELGRLSEYQVSLLSMRADLDLNEILGKKVTVKLVLMDDSQREFTGYVTRIALQGSYGRYTRYVATVRPWLWFLTRTTDCRIFQEMSVPEIIETVFADHPTADFRQELTGSYRKRGYCVQYRETDFNFVSRLMEEEGIYYFFKNEEGKNQLVLTDSYSGHAPFNRDYEELTVVPPDRLVRPDWEHISSWEVAREVVPGAYAHDDYDLERPSVELLARKAAPRPHAHADYEVYDYPGNYLQKRDGETVASIRLEEFASRFEVVEAVTNAHGVAVGCLLRVVGHPREDQNREYLITSASYDLEFSDYEAMPDRGGTSYRCTFTAMPSQEQFRPQRLTPRPVVQGPQTAVVVGPAGEEIHSEKFAQVKVQFHWDRYGKRDENSSCWIRVAQPWAGKGWGSVVIPRIGQEVVVEFLEGDPDQPLITGCVYNGDNLPPYPQPGSAVVSGLKSNTHKGTGYNEISMDDTAGKEKITIHAQYDMSTTVEHDQTDKINNNRSTTVAVDDTESIGSKQAIDIGADRTLKIGANDTISVGAKQEISVAANQDVSVGGNRTITVTGNDEIGAGANMKHSAAANLDLSAGVDLGAVGGVNVKISGGATVEVSAGATIKLSAAGSSIEIGPAGITISSPALVTLTGATIKLN